MNNKIFLSREEGQGLVEYALILVLVAIVVIAVLLQVGPQISKQFCTVTSYLQGGDVVFCGGGSSGGAITNVTASYSARNQELKIIITVSQATTVTVTGAGGISDSRQCSVGTCDLDFSNPPVSGSVTVTDSSGGVGVIAYW